MDRIAVDAEVPARLDNAPVDSPGEVIPANRPGRPPRFSQPGLLSALSFRRLSAIYIFLILFVIFSLWIPQTFLTASTWRSVLDGQALTAMAAIALLIPVAAGAFDLAIGAQIGFTSIFISWLLVNHGFSVLIAVPLTVLIGASIGGLSALLVAAFRIDSFIATLGVSSVILACTNWLSGGAQILNLPEGFSNFSTQRIFGITVPVYLMVLIALIVWYVLENTPLGRRIYATGGNEASARLAGDLQHRVEAASGDQTSAARRQHCGIGHSISPFPTVVPSPTAVSSVRLRR